MATTTRKETALPPLSVRFGREESPFLKILTVRAKAQDRSISNQLKHYARLGMIAADNPDLPLSLIEGILEAREEFRAGLGKPYEFGVLKPEI